MPDLDSYEGMTLADALCHIAEHHVEPDVRHIHRDEAELIKRAAEWLDAHGCREQVRPPQLPLFPR